MKCKPFQSQTDPNQKHVPNSQTYIHYNSSASGQSSSKDAVNTGGQKLKQSMSSNMISSPSTLQQSQKQQQQMNSMMHQPNTLQRTNSSTNPGGYYQAMSNASMTSYTAPSTPQQQNQQFQQAPSPYHYQQPMSNQSSSYPGSSSAMLNTNIGTPNSNAQQNFMNTAPGSAGSE